MSDKNGSDHKILFMPIGMSIGISIGVAIMSFFVGVLAKKFLGVDL